MLKMLGAAGAAPLISSLPWTQQRALAQHDVSGAFTYWQVPPETAVEMDNFDAFIEAVMTEFPNVNLTTELISYGDMLDTLRVALREGDAPHVATLPVLWGIEFAANGFLRPLKPENVGYTADQFGSNAMSSNRWQGETYGIPTHTETMAFLYNRRIFEEAGLDPDTPPATWEQVAEFSKQIHDNLGISGFGMVARLNHGNTPFRFMPVLWAYGGSVLDELEANPTFTEVRINSPETHAALQLYHDMYVRDQSVPHSALRNSQTENRELFLAEQVAMMISHPAEFDVIADMRPDLVDVVDYALYPEGPVRRAAMLGGSNIHVFNTVSDENLEAALALVRLRTNPEWASRFAWFSNPGNLNGFDQVRSEQIKFLDVAAQMLQYGVAFPAIPESAEIMRQIIPAMIHNVLTETMSIEDAAAEAEAQIKVVLTHSARRS